MKVTITYPVRTDTDLLQPGEVADVPAELAQMWIENDWAIVVPEDQVIKPVPTPRKRVEK